MTLLQAAQDAAEDIRMFLDGEWDGSPEGWRLTMDKLNEAIKNDR